MRNLLKDARFLGVVVRRHFITLVYYIIADYSVVFTSQSASIQNIYVMVKLLWLKLLFNIIFTRFF